MKTLLLSITLCLLTGCEAVPHYDRVKVVNLEGIPKKVKAKRANRKQVETVKLFQDKDEVKRPYDVMALMSVDGRAGDEAAFISAFLYRAADLGADAVILYRVNVSEGMAGGGFIMGKGGGFGMPMSSTQDAFYRAEAIRWK